MKKKQNNISGQVIIQTDTVNGVKKFVIKKFPIYFGTQVLSSNTIQLPPKSAKNKHGKLDYQNGMLIYEELGERFATKINDVAITQTIIPLRPGTSHLKIGHVNVTIENEIINTSVKSKIPTGLVKYLLYGTVGLAIIALVAFLVFNFALSKEYKLEDFNFAPTPLLLTYPNSLATIKFDNDVSIEDLDDTTTHYTLFINNKDSLAFNGKERYSIHLPKNLLSDTQLEKKYEFKLKITSPNLLFSNSVAKTFTVDNRKRDIEKGGVVLVIELRNRILDYKISGAEKVAIDFGDKRKTSKEMEGKCAYFDTGDFTFKVEAYKKGSTSPIMIKTTIPIKE